MEGYMQENKREHAFQAGACALHMWYTEEKSEK